MKPIIYDTKFPSMFKKSKPIRPNMNMTQKQFLKRTTGIDMRRFSVMDGGKVIGGVDCMPYDKKRHGLITIIKNVATNTKEAIMSGVRRAGEVMNEKTGYIAETPQQRASYIRQDIERSYARAKSKAYVSGVGSNAIEAIENNPNLDIEEKTQNINKIIRYTREQAELNKQREKVKLQLMQQKAVRTQMYGKGRPKEVRPSNYVPSYTPRSQGNPSAAVQNIFGELSGNRMVSQVEKIGASEKKARELPLQQGGTRVSDFFIIKPKD
jgi:hypothetical protein